MAAVDYPSLEEISGIDDICTAICLLEEHDVPYDGIENLEELKERLSLEYQRLFEEPFRERIDNAIIEAGQEDTRKRKRLIEMFNELKKIILDKDESRKQEIVEEFLSIDGTTDDILLDCDTRMEDLETGECVILVAGESSSGKSSCINLLCGEDILPVFAGACSSTVVTIRYGAKRSARIKYISRDKPDRVLPDLEGERMNEFRSIAFMKDKQREDGHDIKEIQVFLPVSFLKGGLVIADTPGIGENAFLEEYLMSYIANSHILGFTYIIMSDQNGGVQEDRLLNLLKLIIEEQKKNGKQIPFDPKATLFVCNRIDAIEEESRQMVKDHILQKLGKYYPEFEEGQAVFFSAKKSSMEVDVHPDYINAQYRTLLIGLQKLFSDSMDRRIRSSYKWIENVLRRMIHLFKTTVNKLDKSEKDRLGKSRNIKGKITTLRDRADSVIRELRATIDAKIRIISGEIHKYLQTPQCKFRLCSAWTEDEIPKLEDIENVEEKKSDWIREKVDTAFFNRFCNFLENWESSDDGKITDIESEVIEEVKQQLGILEGDIIDFESDMRDDRSSLGGSGRDDVLRRKFSLSLQAGSPIELSPKLALQLAGRVKSKSVIYMLQHMNTEKKMVKDPVAWATKRSEKLFEKLIKNKQKDGEPGILDQFVRQLLQRPLEYIDKVGEKIPNMIQADEDLLNKIEDMCQSERKHRAKYEHMMEKVEGLRRCLMDYGEGYIFVNDFKSNEVKILQQVQGGGSMAKTFSPKFSKMISNSSGGDLLTHKAMPQGLWTAIYAGLLQQEQTQSKISLKFYLPSSGVDNTFQEVAKLRCMISSDMPLAEFLGIHHAESHTPAFIYSGHLQSIGSYVGQVEDKQEFVPKTLMDIAKGLNYIHSKGLVHMEISVSTITVDENGNVKLSGACIPRHAALPNATEHPVADFVYLAPEVLKRELYIAQADVYGFGILMYELICERKAFKHERKISFSEFLVKVNPEQMLCLNDHESVSLNIRQRNLIRDCVNGDAQRRPHISKVIEHLTKLKNQLLRKSISITTNVGPRHVFTLSTRMSLQ